MALASIFDVSTVRAEFENAGISCKFVPLIWKYVLRSPNCNWNEIPDLPSSSYLLLLSKFLPLTSSVTSALDSTDGVTTKLLIKLRVLILNFLLLRTICSIIYQNGEFVETVIMKYDSRLGTYCGNPRPGGLRSTLCVSSQVGCKMGCKFCATGSMGFKRNLSAGEIVEQLVHASQLSSIRNIVFMGMGEPLNNYHALVEAIHIMQNAPFRLSPKRITISTVGVLHAISKLPKDLPGLNLAVSLHAPVQELRCKIMPAARASPLNKLIDGLKEYQRNTGKRILIEYIMLEDVNDGEENAHQLGKVLQGLEVVVNLIPFNPIGDLSVFRTSKDEKVVTFQKVLRGVYEIRTTIRKQMGSDISGACGQLVVTKEIEDFCK